MIYNNVSIENMYRRIQLTLSLKNDNEYANIIEFTGWALKEIGHFSGLERRSKQLEIVGHKAAWPCDFNSLIQTCYNGVPLNYSNETFKFDYLICDECVRTYDYKSNIVRYNTRLDNVGADYQSNDGTNAVNINQVVLVSAGHDAGGTIGDYYKRILTNLGATNLSIVDYSGGNWENVTDEMTSLRENRYIAAGINPYEAWYTVNPGYINTSFEEGTIEISYYALPVDDRGHPKIPDDEAYKWAVEYYVKIRLIGRGYTFPQESLLVCKEEWKKYREQAKSNADMPNIDQIDNFVKRWMRPIQVLDMSQNFFKPLIGRS